MASLAMSSGSEECGQFANCDYARCCAQIQKPVEAAASSCILQGIQDVKKSPAFFTCASGELLWGQVHTVVEGSTSTELDTNLGPQDVDATEDGGTIMASSFHYKVAARKGQWKVASAFQDDFEGKPWHIGFVCHHVDVNGLEILQAASKAGVGSTGKFGDLDIVFVNRYDWSGSHSPGCELIVEAVEGKKVDFEEEEFEDESYYRSLEYGRFMLVDKQSYPTLLQALKDGERLEQRNYVMHDTCSNSSGDSNSQGHETSSSTNHDQNFGVHLVLENRADGYDMGWMAFQDAQLVGFVYDGAYSALEGANLRIDGNVVTA